jgi:hypothetical protein
LWGAQVFLSADDLRVNLWNIENSKESFMIVDIKPPNMEELTEVITGACEDLFPLVLPIEWYISLGYMCVRMHVSFVLPTSCHGKSGSGYGYGFMTCALQRPSSTRTSAIRLCTAAARAPSTWPTCATRRSAIGARKVHYIHYCRSGATPATFFAIFMLEFHDFSETFPIVVVST